MALTRDDLESRRLQQMIAESGLDIHVLTESELEASLDETLQHNPSGSDVWMFAYGSLIWNPIFHHIDRQVGMIHGWHRQFCLWTPLGRGTPDNPGLVLGLDRGGSCRGIAYRVAADIARSEFLLVWRREMIIGSYVPRWVKVSVGTETVNAIAFVINRHQSGYAGKLPLDVAAQHIATAHGMLGSCSDYLMQTVEGLHSAEIADQYLLKLRDRVLKLQQSGTVQVPGNRYVGDRWKTRKKAV